MIADSWDVSEFSLQRHQASSFLWRPRRVHVYHTTYALKLIAYPNKVVIASFPHAFKKQESKILSIIFLLAVPVYLSPWKHHAVGTVEEQKKVLASPNTSRNWKNKKAGGYGSVPVWPSHSHLECQEPLIQLILILFSSLVSSWHKNSSVWFFFWVLFISFGINFLSYLLYSVFCDCIQCKIWCLTLTSFQPKPIFLPYYLCNSLEKSSGPP